MFTDLTKCFALFQLHHDLTHWYDKLKKPLIVSEYGADTVAGLHTVRKKDDTDVIN